MDTESVTSLDDLKVLGYFETIKTVLFTKILLLINNSDEQKLIIPVNDSINKELQNFVGFPLYIKALNKGNNELLLNFQEDIISSLLISSWIVFELIIKDLTKKDYSLSKEDISTDYKKNIFGLSEREKKDLDLFYYIRNAMVHYNGAYYSYREIDHTYEGFRYFSKGKEGEKIFIPSLEVAFKMHLDMENYIYKAWGNYQNYKKS